MIEWRSAVGWEGYSVSNTGSVRKDKTGKILLPFSNHGYQRVKLYNGKKLRHVLVHCLVAEAFLERVEGKNEIDHINNCREDNRVENLRWVSHKENMNNPLSVEVKRKRAQEINRKPEYRAKQRASHAYKAIPVRCVETGIVYESMREAERQTGLDMNVIQYRLQHPNCVTSSFHFEYVNKLVV